MLISRIMKDHKIQGYSMNFHHENQELTAIAYSDWDELYGRPAVAAFGGREVTAASGPQDFNLGGQ